MSALRAADTSLTISNTVFDRGRLGSSVTSLINAPIFHLDFHMGEY